MSNTPPQSSSRTAPPKIDPITKDGIRYESRWKDGQKLFAVDATTGAAKWEVQVIDYWIPEGKPNFAVYFASMELSKDGKTMLIQDERRIRYAVDLQTRRVSILNWLVRVKQISAAPTPKGWKYGIELTVHNSLNRVMKLDEPSVAFGGEAGKPGRISNDLFKVTSDGKEVPYHGEMMKRAAPSRFIELKPGEDYKVVVELGEAYPVPPGDHKMTVKFAHTNHFAPDGFTMESAPLAFELSGAAWELKPKPRPE